ncbi:hypothetical protein [Phormidium nigroviride]
MGLFDKLAGGCKQREVTLGPAEAFALTTDISWADGEVFKEQKLLNHLYRA